MPPKQRITREMIMESAFEMFCREGMDAVNARSVAKALGCSTQPIFSYYTGMQELRDTLNQKAREMFADKVLSTQKGDAWLVDMCQAFVCFVIEQPHVYSYLYNSVCQDNANIDALKPYAAQASAHIAATEGISPEAAAAVCREVVIYASGLGAYALLFGMKPETAREKLEKMYAAVLATIR